MWIGLWGAVRARTETALMPHDYLHSDCEFADLNRDCDLLEKGVGFWRLNLE